MKALIDHRLGEVERRHPGAVQETVVEQRLVHARGGIGCAHHVAQLRQDVIGVEDGVLGDLAQSVGAVAQHVGVGAGEHAHLSVKGLDAAQRFGPRRGLGAVLDQAQPIAVVDDEGQRRIGRQRLRQHHRAGARAAPAVRRREGLVQVDVHGVDAEVARPHPPDERVEVCTIAVEERAGAVNQLGDFKNAVLEQAAGVGVGEHDRGHVRAQLAF